MRDWNVVASVRERGYRQARDVLEEFGPVAKTDFYNVLVLKVEVTRHLLETLRERFGADESLASALARVVPVTRRFTFQTPEEFERRAKEAVLPWVSELAGKGFHVRMHRRGFKGRLSSQHEERFLDGFLMEQLEKAGTPARITFESPDVIIDVETLGQEAGLALWTREELKRYPFLGLD